jgi:ABC-type lipoprotein export system ATPase subunit
MLLVESRILLFDDLINVLEISKEKMVWELLNKMKKNHTIIIISHANDIIKKADHVYDVSDKYVSLIK